MIMIKIVYLFHFLIYILKEKIKIKIQDKGRNYDEYISYNLFLII